MLKPLSLISILTLVHPNSLQGYGWVKS